MSITHDDLVSLWGTDNLIYFPLDRFESRLGDVGPEEFPPDGAFPMDVPILFTTEFPAGKVQPFALLEIQAGNQGPMSLIVLGCSPSDSSLVFCLDADSGAVALLDFQTGHLEFVNSTFAHFVEFLFRIGELIATDPGGRERVTRAAQIRIALLALDPHAFEDPDWWWPLAFQQLASTPSAGR